MAEPSGDAAGAHAVCDLSDADRTADVVRAAHPEAVIHTQAFSDVDGCEREPQAAEALNIQTIEHLCRGLKSSSAWLVALSTDYVFDGQKGTPYDEADEPRPISVYGRTKLEGERIVLRYPRGLIVRPSTLFGPDRMNFCELIVQRFTRHEPVEAFVDQTISPTYTEDLAEGIARLLEAVCRRAQEPWPRIYHITNAGQASRVEFAQAVARALRVSDEPIRAVRMADQHRPAPRPPYSALRSRHLTAVIGSSLRPWQDALHAYLVKQHWLN